MWPRICITVLLVAGRALGSEPLDDAAIKALAQRFAELKCGGPADMSREHLNRHWCPVARIEGSGPLKPPVDRRTLLGLSMVLRPGASVISAALASTDLAILTIGPTGALLTSLKPSNAQERESLGKVVASLALVVKGRSTSIELPADLRDYLKTFDAKGLHPLAPLPAGAAYAGTLPARIYRVSGPPAGEAYVVVERAPDGWWINLFPVAQTPATR